MSEQTRTVDRIREREMHVYWMEEARKTEREFGEGGDLPPGWSEPVSEPSDLCDRTVESNDE